MSEQAVLLTPELAAPDYQASIEAGIEAAREYGFELEQALAADTAESLNEEAIAKRAPQVIEMAATIANDIGLKPEFFERPANTILMTSVANVWLQNQAKAEKAPEHDVKLADERVMLVDIALMAAGNQARFVEELAVGKHAEAKRYVQENNPETSEAKCVEYLESINDKAMAAEVKELFSAEGEGSVLNKQREILGITAETEESYEVRVLQLGTKWDLINAGVLPKPEWPNNDQGDYEDFKKRSAMAMAVADRQNEMYQVYAHNQEVYDQQFGEELGDLAPAFVTRTGGKPTLYIKTATAASLIKMAAEGVNFDEVKDTKDYSVTEPVATVRHEYVHTQKNFALGERMQLGLVLEERKAEYASHDKLGYQDIKYLLNDLGMAQDVRFVDEIDTALKQPDALSAWMAWSAVNLGLRNTMLLMAAKPLPYDRYPESAERFASMKSVIHRHDHSTHDAIVRENLVDQENVANFRARAAKWAAGLVTDGNVDIEFIRETYGGYRAGHGLAHANQYLMEALDEAVQAAATEPTSADAIIR